MVMVIAIAVKVVMAVDFEHSNENGENNYIIH